MDPTLRSVIRETKAGHIDLSRFMFVCFTSKDTCDGVGKEEDFKSFFFFILVETHKNLP